MNAVAIVLLIATASEIVGHTETCASVLVRTPRPSSQQDCILSPGDVIYIAVWRGCTWELPVIRQDGTFTWPLIGQVQAAGLTPSQLAVNIEGLLSTYLNRPQVTVAVADNINQKRFWVDGSASGRYILNEPITVLDAISKAAELSNVAGAKQISILRGSAPITLKYKRLLKHSEENILVENGDRIVIIR